MEKQAITLDGHTFELVDRIPLWHLIWGIGRNIVDSDCTSQQHRGKPYSSFMRKIKMEMTSPPGSRKGEKSVNKQNAQDYQDQIIRKDARSCFVEVKNDCFHLDKIHLQFVTYDQNLPTGQRYTNNIHIYINVPEFLVLAKEAETGALHTRAMQMKREGKTDPLFEHLGGTAAAQLKKYGKERPDGMSLSRIVKLVGGSKTDYLLVADSGPGEQSGKGLIVPRFGKKPEQHVAVRLTWRGVNEILLTTAAHYQAWLSAKYSSDWAQLHAPRLEGKPRPGGSQEAGRAQQPVHSEPAPQSQPEGYGFGSAYGI